MISNDRVGSFATKIVLFREGVVNRSTGTINIVNLLLETFNNPKMMMEYIKNDGFSDEQIKVLLKKDTVTSEGIGIVDYDDLLDVCKNVELLKKPYNIDQEDVINFIRSAEIKEKFLEHKQFKSRSIGNLSIQSNNTFLQYFHQRIKNYIKQGEHDFGFLLY
jgi:hypothetical protein